MTPHDDMEEYAAPISGDDAQSSLFPRPDHDEQSHAGRTMLLVVITLVLGGGVFLGLWLWTTVNAKVVVPTIVGMTTSEASDRLAEAGLADGRVNYDVTRGYPTDLITAQSPAAGTLVPAMNQVNVQLAVLPKPLVVPDLYLMDSTRAQQLLTNLLLKPVLLYAYNRDIPADTVIEQLPRSGDSAVTGGEEVLVISLGPGISGTTVPSVVGLNLNDAHSIVTSSTLFPVILAVDDPSADEGTIVDQCPSAGSLVPAASRLMLSVALKTPPITP
jgi:beta-lactam-binding protein with PASTA domain